MSDRQPSGVRRRPTRREVTKRAPTCNTPARPTPHTTAHQCRCDTAPCRRRRGGQARARKTELSNELREEIMSCARRRSHLSASQRLQRGCMLTVCVGEVCLQGHALGRRRDRHLTSQTGHLTSIRLDTRQENLGTEGYCPRVLWQVDLRPSPASKGCAVKITQNALRGRAGKRTVCTPREGHMPFRHVRASGTALRNSM